jgi:hypothetical protein
MEFNPDNFKPYTITVKQYVDEQRRQTGDRITIDMNGDEQGVLDIVEQDYSDGKRYEVLTALHDFIVAGDVRLTVYPNSPPIMQ